MDHEEELKGRTRFIGIDIGVAGAIAILDQDGALIEIHDMPTLLGRSGRRDFGAKIGLDKSWLIGMPKILVMPLLVLALCVAFLIGALRCRLQRLPRF